MDRTTAHQLVSISEKLANFSSLEAVCHALESSLLLPSSTTVVRRQISEGNGQVDAAIRQLQEMWRQSQDLNGAALSFALKACTFAGEKARASAPKAQAVWSGPIIDGSYLRMTREVIKELVAGAKHEILVVGYWLVTNNDPEGIISEILHLLANASRLGRKVTFILDERTRDGLDNFQSLASVWPSDLAPPDTYTWHLPPGDAHLKLHAKVIVCDRKDALVTSANLTHHAINRNMEMGFRVIGKPAFDIASHFELLILQKVIEPLEK